MRAFAKQDIQDAIYSVLPHILQGDSNFVGNAHGKNPMGVYYFSEVNDSSKQSVHEDETNPAHWSYWRKKNFEFFDRELGKKDKGLLIDIGAGPMQFRSLYERFTPIGVDFWPYKYIQVVVDLNKNLPFKDNCADVLILSNVLEHIAEPGILLSECARILKPNGVLLGAVPFMIESHQRPFDYQRFTDIGLRYLLDKYFNNSQIEPVLSSYIVYKNASDRFFVDMNRSYAGTTAQLFVRVFWFFYRRVYLKVLEKLSHKQKSAQVGALGYHFICTKI